MDALTRYASYVLEGCDSPPGNESARWGHVIGLEPHPYSWVIQAGPDKGAIAPLAMPTPGNCSAVVNPMENRIYSVKYFLGPRTDLQIYGKYFLGPRNICCCES